MEFMCALCRAQAESGGILKHDGAGPSPTPQEAPQPHQCYNGGCLSGCLVQCPQGPKPALFTYSEFDCVPSRMFGGMLLRHVQFGNKHTTLENIASVRSQQQVHIAIRESSSNGCPTVLCYIASYHPACHRVKTCTI